MQCRRADSNPIQIGSLISVERLVKAVWGHFLKSESSKGRLVQAEGSLLIEIYHKCDQGRGAGWAFGQDGHLPTRIFEKQE